MTLVTTSSSTRLIAMTSSSDSRSSAPNRSARSPSRRISDRSLTSTAETLDIQPAQHGSGRLVEQIGAPHVLEPVEQVVGPQALLFRAAEVVQHRSAAHRLHSTHR